MLFLKSNFAYDLIPYIVISCVIFFPIKKVTNPKNLVFLVANISHKLLDPKFLSLNIQYTYCIKTNLICQCHFTTEIMVLILGGKSEHIASACRSTVILINFKFGTAVNLSKCLKQIKLPMAPTYAHIFLNYHLI